MNENNVSRFFILPRTLQSWTVHKNDAIHRWVATIQIQQETTTTTRRRQNKKRNKKKKDRTIVFSFKSEEEAIEFAKSNAPPRMLPFSDWSSCYICDRRLSLWNRPGHCRNCGACICSSCCVKWPSIRIPKSYNLKGETHVKVCKSCNWIGSALKSALLRGNFQDVKKLYECGNVNLRRPLSPQNKEIMLPVHCAALGGNIAILRWLIDERHCPTNVDGNHNLICTSKGNSILDLALASRNVDVLRYLVVEKDLSLLKSTSKNLKMALCALDSVIRTHNPSPSLSMRRHSVAALSSMGYIRESTAASPFHILVEDKGRNVNNNDNDNDDELTETDEMLSGTDEASTSDVTASDSLKEFQLQDISGDSTYGNDDECKLCFDNNIDCVLIPCGHQICCMECAKNLSSCPICGIQCSMLKTYRS